MNKEGIIKVGKVVGVHGIRGEIKVLSFGEIEEDIWDRVQIKSEAHFAEYKVIGRRTHKNTVLLKLRGIDTREEASRLIGCCLFVDRCRFRSLPEGEYYWFELVGMEVEGDDGRWLGVVSSIFSTGSNDVYVLNGPYGELYIPAIKDVILKVDVKAGKILIHLLEGLL